MPMKLVVIGGPSRGATYFLQEGENSIGRAENNTVVLPSGQVSKTHCIVSVRNARAEVADNASANGTFVNGVLVKTRVLKPKDKISVGPFVMEFVSAPTTRAVATRPSQTAPAGLPPMDLSANVPAFGTDTAVTTPVGGDADLGAMNQSLQGGGGDQKSLVVRLKHRFDEVVLPVLHDYNERQETATLIIILFAIFVVLNIGFTIYPILEQSREEVLREAQNKAKYIAQQIDELNRNDVSMGRESVLNVDFAESEPNMKEALIVNMEGRILAPSSRLNESYNDPFFLSIKDKMMRDPGAWKVHGRRFGDQAVIRVIHPIMIFNKAKQMNAPGAMAVVVLSTASINLDPGTVGVIYFEALATSVILGAIFLYLVYALLQRPVHHLNENLDRALRGEIDEVSKKYRNPEFDSLIDTVNAAISRIPKSTGETGMDMGAASASDQQMADNFLRTMESMAVKLNRPALILDAEFRIRAANQAFEDVTGIRASASVGDVFDNVSRDESFPALLKEIAEKSKVAGVDGVDDQYEFPSGLYKLNVQVVSGVPGRADAFLYLMEKNEG